MQRGRLADVVVRQRAVVLELLACEDEPLLVGRDTLLGLDLGLDVLNRVAALHLQGDGLTFRELDEDTVRGLMTRSRQWHGMTL